MFGIDRGTCLNPAGEKVVNVEADPRTPYVLVELRDQPGDKDCIFYLELEDTAFGKLEVSFLIINDPRAPRFDTDLDEQGRRTKFATVRRNLPEEVRAMQAGLAPAQVRKGLHLLKDFLALVMDFAECMGQDMIISEPLTYNAAITFERHGWDYMRGRRRMEQINQGFQPGGELFAQLDGSTPFRQPGMDQTVLGRSWAVHDGILGEPWRGVEMYMTPQVRRRGHLPRRTLPSDPGPLIPSGRSAPPPGSRPPPCPPAPAGPARRRPGWRRRSSPRAWRRPGNRGAGTAR